MTKLPDTWRWSTLGEQCDLYQPKTISREKMMKDGSYEVYGANGVIGMYNEYNHEESEVLLSCRGNCGTVNVSKPKSWINGNAMVCRPKTSALLKSYLRYYLESVNFAKVITGTAQQQITREPLSKVEIAIPPIDEQRKIVELLEDHLSRLDAALADVRQAKILASQFRRSLLQAGLNGFFNNGPIDEISGLSKTWRLKTLADVADWTSGGTPSSKDSALYGGDIPWIVIGDLTEAIVLDTEKKITQKGLDSSSAKKLPVGTVMVAMYGASIGRTGVMGKEMTTNQAIACGIPKDDEILGQYLLYFLQSQKNEFIAAGKGGAQPNISQGVVKSWRIPLPPLDEQLEIITEIDSQLEHLAQANRATETLLKGSIGLRRSLLQAAFTGQLTNEVVSV
jgi:type I restriction enzyme S subunit